jgi:formylglycine-generating enzyme required for sulfatase activity
MKSTAALILLTYAFLPAPNALGDSFGSGANTFDIEFVSIGTPSNPADVTGNPNPAGRVDYAYRIGKHEISRDMIAKANDAGGLGLTLDSMVFVDGGARDDMPATGISWFEAARFVNWPNTNTSHAPAYKFSRGTFQLWQPGDPGYNASNPFRNSQARYVLPSSNEWYKAAYYDPAAGVYYDYPTASNTAPVAADSGTGNDTAVWGQALSQGPADIALAGSFSSYGTIGQVGNVWEWEETDFDLLNDSSSSGRGVRGGAWEDTADSLLSSTRPNILPGTQLFNIGFRVVSVPEPSTAVFAGLATMARLK